MRAERESPGTNFETNDSNRGRERDYDLTEIEPTGHGHLLYYTPPYHPTLQPIELIWGLVKNRIAMDPPKNGSDAVAKVLQQLAAIKPEEWLARFHHVQEIEDQYLEAADDFES
ncbi:uncharacterized protein IUM83_18475 [Phytophthora cinnamomi]|uniref:uncharacterized protein n=1 Tax=Phytophthora cinnamomi TaxID=4785 RepID=UPI00355AB83A|nr:hypothetical protein IUM83_18475 [Phytophthora cinnamomi]